MQIKCRVQCYANICAVYNADTSLYTFPSKKQETDGVLLSFEAERKEKKRKKKRGKKSKK